MFPARKAMPAVGLSCLAVIVAYVVLATHQGDKSNRATRKPAVGTESHYAEDSPGYWTPERMRDAQPMEMPEGPADPPPGSVASESSQDPLPAQPPSPAR
jgi:hypothetical protein